MPNSADVTVLLVEDDEIDVMGIRRAFRSCGLDNRIVVAADGLEALAKIRDEKAVPRPCFVVLDLNMPRMNGIEFLGRLRTDPELHNTVVFVMTTSQDEHDKSRAYGHNVAGYIIKQRSVTGLVNAVDLFEQYTKTIEFP